LSTENFVHLDGMSAQELEDMALGTMLGVDGPTLVVELERAPETLERSPRGSFSVEALNGIDRDVSAWIETRIMRRWRDTGEAPVALRVEVAVAVA
jgi:hypothetical protein